MKLKSIFLFSLLSIFNINAHSAFLTFPVESGISVEGATLDILDQDGASFGAVPVDVLNPASGDFDFTYLGAYGFGYNSTFYSSPGTYNFDSTPDSVFPDVVDLSMTVGTNQVGMRTFIEWNANIYDVLAVWDVTDNTYMATDMDGDGVRGYQMVSGPFAGLNVVLDIQISSVPVPAAVWLFGSGLLGLIGVARRKK